MQAMVNKALNTHDYNEFNDIIRKIASAPNTA